MRLKSRLQNQNFKVCSNSQKTLKSMPENQIITNIGTKLNNFADSLGLNPYGSDGRLIQRLQPIPKRKFLYFTLPHRFHMDSIWKRLQHTILFENHEVFTFPGLIHMESMWNPWNPSAIPCGIHGMNVG